MGKIPKLKKKISAFLKKEDGKMSKENIIKLGILLGAAAIGSLGTEAGCPPDTQTGTAYNRHNDHCNELSLQYTDPTSTGTHQHGHTSHASHGSHSSHGSHTSW